MKTIPERDEMNRNISKEDFAELLQHRQLPAAHKFGTYHDWTEEDWQYLIREMMSGQHDFGHDTAVMAMCLFIIAADVSGGPKLVHLLYSMGTYLQCAHWYDLINPEAENPADLEKFDQLLDMFDEPLHKSLLERI